MNYYNRSRSSCRMTTRFMRTMRWRVTTVNHESTDRRVMSMSITQIMMPSGSETHTMQSGNYLESIILRNLTQTEMAFELLYQFARRASEINTDKDFWSRTPTATFFFHARGVELAFEKRIREVERKLDGKS